MALDSGSLALNYSRARTKISGYIHRDHDAEMCHPHPVKLSQILCLASLPPARSNHSTGSALAQHLSDKPPLSSSLNSVRWPG